jgi:hypothetical protein
MKISFHEERRGRKVDLVVAVTEIHPLLKPFKAKVKKSNDDVYSIAIEKYGTQEVWEGGVINTAYLIHTGNYDSADVPKVKAAFKLYLKPALEKAGFMQGLTEEKVK